MKRKYLRSCIALLLVFTVLCCGAVSSSAYNPIVTIKSSDWKCEEYVNAYEYPDKISIGDDASAFRQYDELYGETCYFSSKDDSAAITAVDVEINPADYKYKGFYIFEYNNTIYMYNFNPDDFTFCFDSNGRLKIWPWNDNWDSNSEWYDLYLNIYYAKYPYNSFQKGTTLKFSDYLYSGELPEGSLPLGEYYSYHTARNIYPVYCTEDVYGMADDIDHNVLDVIHKADEPITATYSFNIELTESCKLYTGLTSLELTSTQIQQFSLGRYAFRFNNLGFINGYDSLLSYVYFQMNIYDHDHQVYISVPLLEHSFWDAVGMTNETEKLPAYSACIDDFVAFWENELDDLDTGVYNCIISFVFVCDTFAAFFPGTIDIVEFDNYEDDMEHEDVLNAVDEAASVISGEISSASSALSQEIVKSASDIKDSINDSAADIVSSVDSAASDLSDKLDDVSDSIDNASDKLSDKLGDVKDGITNKLTEVKDNLLDGIKSFFIPSDEVMEEIDDKWDELLKSRFGALYEVSGIITDFASQMSWDYVKSAGEKNTITMPSVTVQLVDTDFTFGGYEVKVVPDGFDVLTTALKGITSIVCTLMFVNALRKKYDKLVGGNVA